ncbi:MAG: hypothetical protein QOJ65_305 [Fimbriimonadaceae bacterium]|jgi:hypothetical protein|nr:hypothetical protein [Fimbriimonadaceae bacterium]
MKRNRTYLIVVLVAASFAMNLVGCSPAPDPALSADLPKKELPKNNRKLETTPDIANPK